MKVIIQALSVLFAAVPFAFGLIRWVQTGSDHRYLWVALASSVGAVAAMVGGRASSRRPPVVVVAPAAFLLATLLAMAAAVLLGTRFGPAMVVVTTAFGFCSAAGCLLHVLARSWRV